MSSNRRVTFLVRLTRNGFGTAEPSNRPRTSLERRSGSVFDESSVLTLKSTVRGMGSVYIPSRYLRSDDRDTGSVASRRRIRKGLRRLTRRITRAIRKEQENAV